MVMALQDFSDRGVDLSTVNATLSALKGIAKKTRNLMMSEPSGAGTEIHLHGEGPSRRRAAINDVCAAETPCPVGSGFAHRSRG